MHGKPTPLTPIYKEGKAGGRGGELQPRVSAQGGIPAQLSVQLLKLMPAVRGQSEEIKRLRGCNPFPRVHGQNFLCLLAASFLRHKLRSPSKAPVSNYLHPLKQPETGGKGGMRVGAF